MFSRYYQSELSYLRELGRDFAVANPSLAGLFAERGGDPDVERLLEGFAFLSARIRERLDDALPEVVEQLCQLALPQYVRSIPAMTIVEFSPAIRALKGIHKVPDGSELGTRAVQGTPCLFRTTRELELLPLVLNAVALDPSTETEPKLRLSFQTTEIGKQIVPTARSIQLFLHGGLGQTTTLFLWFMRHLRTVTVIAGEKRIELPLSAIRPTTLLEGGSTLPWPEFAPQDMRLTLEYYSMPSLLLFVEIGELAKLEGVLEENFDIVLQFDRAPKLPERIERDSIRLHCVPAINLFETTTEPVVRDISAHEHVLRAAGLESTHADVFQVKRVTGLRPKSAPVEYASYFDFTHMNQPESGQQYYWLKRGISPLDGGLDTHASFGNPRDLSPELFEETVSLDVVCTNRNLPNELRVGDVSVATNRSPTVAPFKNILPVTRPIRPAIGNELGWRFIAHIAVNQRSLSDPNALRSILGLYNFHESVDVQLGRANRLRVDAIRKVDIASAKRLVDHIPTRGVRTTIEMDETAFASLGDVYLFGCSLDAFFAAQAPLNTFHELAIVAHPSGSVLTWTPRSGIEPVY